ncbi:MAG TPA: SCP2 sterol-binding domain-containing protein [Jiangellaceae bacterium]|nr:SCP2 sterol-binding domain-containing protein [Jiangellaceae bacterium]
MGGVAFLGAEWLALARELFGDVAPRPRATARVQRVVTGAPGGDVVFTLAFEDGRLVDTALADGTESDPDAELTITTTYDDTLALASGDLDLSVAVMQGRAKVAGSMGALLAILPVTRSQDFRAARAALHERTATP